MSTRLKNRSFLNQLLVALGRTSPAYTAGDPGSGRSRGGQIIAALGRGPVAAQHADEAEAANSSAPLTSGDPGSIPSVQDGGSAVADLLLSRPPATRLSLRSHPGMLTIALAFRTQFARAYTRSLEQALEHDYAHARDIARELTGILPRARARARNLAFALDPSLQLELPLDLDFDLDFPDIGDLVLTLDLALDLDRARARDLALDLLLNLDNAQGLAHDLARDRDRATGLALDLDIARDLARVTTLYLDRAYDRAYDLARALALDLDRAFARALVLDRDRHDLSRAFDRALSDFTDADLRSADLAGLSLMGIRWSRATRWPSAWVEEIERLSVEIEPGIFEIRGGTATVDMSADLVGV